MENLIIPAPSGAVIWWDFFKITCYAADRNYYETFISSQMKSK